MTFGVSSVFALFIRCLISAIITGDLYDQTCFCMAYLLPQLLIKHASSCDIICTAGGGLDSQPPSEQSDAERILQVRSNASYFTAFIGL